MTQPIYIAEDSLFRWDRARHASDGTYVNAGSGVWTLKDSDDMVLATGAMSYVADSDGRWHGTIDAVDAADLEEGETYWLEVSLDDGAGADAFRRVELVAQYHGEE